MELGLVVDERDGWAVVSVSGEVDLATAPGLRERLQALIAEGKARLVIDLDDVGFLDSTALGVLIGALRRARSAGGDVRLVASTPRVTKVLEITRLDQAFAIFDSADAAVAAEG